MSATAAHLKIHSYRIRASVNSHPEGHNAETKESTSAPLVACRDTNCYIFISELEHLLYYAPVWFFWNAKHSTALNAFGSYIPALFRHLLTSLWWRSGAWDRFWYRDSRISIRTLGTYTCPQLRRKYWHAIIAWNDIKQLLSETCKF